ncbi:MAG: TonB family protein [candidate division KSB1 bacterium]|nr:TonB family protein [candidate division KSB1 bacterium]
MARVPKLPTAPDASSRKAPVFVAYDEPPTPIGGLEAIQSKLMQIIQPDWLQAGYRGRAIVNVLVDVDGSVRKTRILRSTGTDRLDRAARGSSELGEVATGKAAKPAGQSVGGYSGHLSNKITALNCG